MHVHLIKGISHQKIGLLIIIGMKDEETTNITEISICDQCIDSLLILILESLNAFDLRYGSTLSLPEQNQPVWFCTNNVVLF